MCGLFGWYGTEESHRLDMDYVREIAIDTESRGPHAYGWSWVDDSGLHMYKRPGRISDNLDALDMLRNARAFVGHTRWVTQGEAKFNRNNHPHKMGRGWFVHNGSIPEYWDILDSFQFPVLSECDSEILGHLYKRQGGRMERRIANAVSCTSSPIAVLALFNNPIRFVAYRGGSYSSKPLHAHICDSGMYFASRKSALEKPLAVKSDVVHRLTGFGKHMDVSATAV